MSKNLIFRILGALASALIIVSVFVPFVSVTGYTSSLWESFSASESLYLPIMIIVFGAIGVIFFALNIKTEFVYMTTGAISFFAVIETVDIINQGVFNTLTIGYYFLVVGAILTGVMTFLTTLKTNKKQPQVEPVAEVPVEPSMLSQIDKLYDSQPVENTMNPVQQNLMDQQNVVSPIPNGVQPIPDTTVPLKPIPDLAQPIPDAMNSLSSTVQSVNPVLQEFTSSDSNVQSGIVNQPLQVDQQNVINSVPSVQPVNPVQNIIQPIESNIVNQVPNAVQPMQEVNPNINQNNQQSVNPVLKEFDLNSDESNNQMITNSTAPIVESVGNATEIDIFGQPINK